MIKTKNSMNCKRPLKSSDLPNNYQKKTKLSLVGFKKRALKEKAKKNFRFKQPVR